MLTKFKSKWQKIFDNQLTASLERILIDKEINFAELMAKEQI
jgi:hypothetical protein